MFNPFDASRRSTFMFSARHQRGQNGLVTIKPPCHQWFFPLVYASSCSTIDSPCRPMSREVVMHKVRPMMAELYQSLLRCHIRNIAATLSANAAELTPLLVLFSIIIPRTIYIYTQCHFVNPSFDQRLPPLDPTLDTSNEVSPHLLLHEQERRTMITLTRLPLVQTIRRLTRVSPPSLLTPPFSHLNHG